MFGIMRVNCVLCVVSIIFVAISGVLGLVKLPSCFKTCRRSDPNLQKCIKETVEDLRPLLIKGIPEFDIPSCEPLYISEVVIDKGAGAVSLKSTYKDINIYGPSKFVIKHIKIDLENDKLRLKIWLPHLQVICKYKMNGRILMMPISGAGISRSNYSNIDATVTMSAERIKKDHETYYNIKDFYVEFNIGFAQMYLDDLFNGDKELGEAMNLFLNENWKQIGYEIKPVLEDTVANIFKKIANKIFHKYPIDTLLPK